MAVTLRECIESGRRGSFAQALLALYDNPTIENYTQALSAADRYNRAALRRVTSHSVVDADGFRRWLEQAFTGLRQLDIETKNPHAIQLRSNGDEDDR